ncbi:MAG: nuclear transport factor 2 family protein [Phycisphaerales bacterium]|nr:nuclear transport factor 2 family protein [Phycisphaerales bacterium]
MTHPSSLIRQSLHDQADAWNHGDIDRFMQDYLKSDELTFVSDGTILRGWGAAYERYRTRYPDRATMGALTFSNLDVRMLNRDSALVLGQWQVARDVRPVGGRFTLVMQRRGGRWVIIHDHTSTSRDDAPSTD